MELVLCRNLWGLQDDPARYADALPGVAAAGYDAVACPVQFLVDAEAFADALAPTGLEYLPQLFTFGRTYDEHLTMFREGLDATLRFAPRHVVCQAGMDAWDRDQALGFFTEALALAADRGATVAFETHRGRVLYNPWITVELVEALPDLLLAADLSHWVCVTESLDLPRDAIATIAPRVVHVDARVGFEEGPQVADPAADRVARHLARHERWWDQIWAAASAAGRPALSMTAEYGPPPYQPVDPYTGDPARDLGEIVDEASARLRARYGGGSG